MKSREQNLSSDLIRNLTDLIREPKPLPSLRREPQPGALPSARGYAEDNSQQLPGLGGGGIASPVTEEHFSTREYWESGIPSSDGLFMFPAPKKITMTDANGAEVIFEYADPAAPEPEE